MTMHLSTMMAGPCESYARGVCEGRRSAEVELEDERFAVMTLAKSLAEAARTFTLYLNPDDMAHVEGPAFDIRIAPDLRLSRGSVRLCGTVA